MHCKCGYNFAAERLKALEEDREAGFESYVVVNDRDYQKLLKRELAVVKLNKKLAAVKSRKQKKEKELRALKKILKSAELTNTLMLCPECQALVMVWQDESKPHYYVRQARPGEGS